MSILNVWLLCSLVMLVVVLTIEVLAISKGKSKFAGAEVSFIIAVACGPISLIIFLIILVLKYTGKIKVTL